ncbi:MAG TPA: hypothetical protein PKY01_19585, partial [Candidatus Hydrogenedentes bacterium]|nr:hypothetical protein [Candidatus Hydrogenedentota bacterium]
MRGITITLTAALLLLQAFEAIAGEEPPAAPVSGAEQPMPLRLGGVGGLYLLATPGELVVEIAKQDKNSRDIQTHLR